MEPESEEVGRSQGVFFRSRSRLSFSFSLSVPVSVALSVSLSYPRGSKSTVQVLARLRLRPDALFCQSAHDIVAMSSLCWLMVAFTALRMPAPASTPADPHAATARYVGRVPAFTVYHDHARPDCTARSGR